MTELQQNTVSVFDKFLDSRLVDVHTSIPGKIISYNANTERACVQPLVRLKRLVNGKVLTVDIPAIDNVPVMFLHVKSFKIKVPLEKGDGVEIRFSEVGIGNFLNGSGSLVDPDDISKFSLTDAICTPGLWGKNLPTNTPTIEVTSSGDLKLLNGKMEIKENAVNMLGATEPFTKGTTLETLLNNFLTALSGIVPGDTTANAAALTIIKAAATAALPNVAGIKSLTIKGE